MNFVFRLLKELEMLKHK